MFEFVTNSSIHAVAYLKVLLPVGLWRLRSSTKFSSGNFIFYLHIFPWVSPYLHPKLPELSGQCNPPTDWIRLGIYSDSGIRSQISNAGHTWCAQSIIGREVCLAREGSAPVTENIVFGKCSTNWAAGSNTSASRSSSAGPQLSYLGPAQPSVQYWTPVRLDQATVCWNTGVSWDSRSLSSPSSSQCSYLLV